MTQAVYERLWAAARDQFATGSVITDPHLLDRAADTRRGLTLILRPDAALRARITALLDELRPLAAGQHFYHPDEYHITLLSVISAAAGFDPAVAPLDTYRAAFAGVFGSAAPLTIHFDGVIAAPDSILLAGTSDNDAINTLRDRVRAAIQAAELGDSAERRYRSVTAHMTVVRFPSQPRDLPGLVDWIAAHRDHAVGSWAADAVEFVSNDWYMTRGEIRVLARYPLRG